MRGFTGMIIAAYFLTTGVIALAAGAGRPLEALPDPANDAVDSPVSLPLPAGFASAEVMILDPDDPGSHPVARQDRVAPEALPDVYLIQNDGLLSVSATEGLLKNDLDPDGDALYITAITAPSNGSLSIAADGRFSYTPDDGFEGDEILTYYLSDGGNSTTGVVTISILPSANRGPIPVADSYALVAGGTLTVPAASGLLVNDVDLDGDGIVVVSITAPVYGSINIAADGSFTYSPDDGFVGAEVMEYQVSDGAQLGATGGQVSIQVLPSGNRAPLGAEDYWYTPSDTPLQVSGALSVVHNDLDPDGDSLTVVSFYPTTHGDIILTASGSFTYSPDAGFEGEDSFSYRLRDSNGTLSSGFTTVGLLIGVYGDLPSGVLTPPEAFGFQLQGAVPNPFNPTTELSFRIVTEGPVGLRVFSMKGEAVAVLVDEILPAGPHTTVWDGRDTAGRPLASGTYLAELRHGGKRAVQKLTLVK